MSDSLVAEVEAEHPAVIALATPLSLAVCIDPPLARAIRLALVPGADVSVELDLWSSPLVQVRTGDEYTLRSDVVDELRGRLTHDADELRRIWALYREAHGGAPPLVRLEERLAYLAHLAEAGIAVEADDVEDGESLADLSAAAAIDRSLRSVVAAMRGDEHRRRDLASWASRALMRLPAIVRDSEGARILGVTAASWVATASDLTALAPSPEGAVLARSLAPGGTATATRQISVRRTATHLELAGEPRAVPWKVIDAAASPPTLIIDDDRTVALHAGETAALEVGLDDVVLGDADGRRWRIPPPADLPDLTGVLSIEGVLGRGYIYIVARGEAPEGESDPRDDLAVTSARNVTPTWSGGAHFRSGAGLAKVVAYDEDSDVALLEVGNYGDCEPVTLSDDAPINAVWRAWTADGAWHTPSRGGARAWHGRVAAAWPALRVVGPDGEGVELHPEMHRPGLPIFIDGQVIGHLTLKQQVGTYSDIYLSHSSGDEEVVSALADRLRGDGLRVWLGPQLVDGEQFEVAFDRALGASRVLIACISESTLGSEWIRDQLDVFVRSDPAGQRRVVPLQLDDTEPPPWLATYPRLAWGPAERSRDDRYSRVLDACRPPRETGVCPARLVRWWIDQHTAPAAKRGTVRSTTTGEPLIPLRLRASATSPTGAPQFGVLVAPSLLVAAVGEHGTGVDAEVVYPDSSLHRARGVFIVDGIVGLVLDDPLDPGPTEVAPETSIASVIGRPITRAVEEAIAAHAAAARPRIATIVLPSPISTAGLLSTGVNRSAEGTAQFREHTTTGRRPWTVRVVDRAVDASQPLEGLIVTIRIEGTNAARPGMFYAEIEDGPGLAGHQPSVIADACHRAAEVLRVEIAMEPVRSSGRGGIAMITRPARGFTEAIALRHALRLATELLATLPSWTDTGGGGGSTFYLNVPESGAGDVGDIEALLLRDATGDFRVVEIDPETDVVEVYAGPDAQRLELLRALDRHERWGETYEAYRVTDRRDVLHGRFGAARQRRGFRLSWHELSPPDTVAGAIELRVRIDQHPVRGHVLFWFPPAIASAPLRVRASDGAATIRMPRSVEYDFTVGAIVEDESVMLELRIPGLPRPSQAPTTETPTTRWLPVVVLADVSGSMGVDGRIQALNHAMREMITAFQDATDLRAEIHLAVITFGGTARMHLPLGPVRNATWTDLAAAGNTPMGAAFDLARELIEDRSQIPDGAYRPTIVLISDGQADTRGGAIEPLRRLLGSDRGGKAFRMALAIGADADHAALSGFLADPDARVFRADEVREIQQFFQLVTMNVSARSRSTDPNVETTPTRSPTAPRLIRTLAELDAPIGACAISADGARVVSGSDDGQLLEWSTTESRGPATLGSHAGRITAIRFSNSDRETISTSADRVCQVRGASGVRHLTAHTAEVLDAAISPDERIVVTASEDRTLRIWNALPGVMRAVLEGHQAAVNACAITPDGRHIVSVSADRAIKVWGLKSRRLVNSFTGVVGALLCCAITPDGRHIVTGSADWRVRMWSLEAGAITATFEGHTNWVTAVAVTPDGRHIVSASEDHTLKIWDVASGACIDTLEGHTAAVHACAISADGRRLVSASEDRTLKIWSLDDLADWTAAR